MVYGSKVLNVYVRVMMPLTMPLISNPTFSVQAVLILMLVPLLTDVLLAVGVEAVGGVDQCRATVIRHCGERNIERVFVFARSLVCPSRIQCI